jgi:hypothetical protein
MAKKTKHCEGLSSARSSKLRFSLDSEKYREEIRKWRHLAFREEIGRIISLVEVLLSNLWPISDMLSGRSCYTGCDLPILPSSCFLQNHVKFCDTREGLERGIRRVECCLLTVFFLEPPF